MDGQVFGHYRIIEKIGAGGMGDVFRARDERLGRDVAIKIIRPTSGNNPDHLRRFEQEARAAAALSERERLALLARVQYRFAKRRGMRSRSRTG